MLKIILIGMMLLVSCAKVVSREERDSTIATELAAKTVVVTRAAGEYGTGFYLKTPSGKSVIITNAHVCMNDKFLNLSRYEGVTFVTTTHEVLKRDHYLDLCAIKAPKGKEGLVLAQKADLFEATYTFGFPNSSPYFSKGFVQSGKESDVKIKNLSANNCTGYFYDLTTIVPRSEEEAKNILNWIKGGVVTLCVVKLHQVMVSNFIYPGASGSAVTNNNLEVLGVIRSRDLKLIAGFMVPYPIVKGFISDL